MKDSILVQWVMDHTRLIQSTQRPTKEEQAMIFKIANLLDDTQTHRVTQCGRCYQSAKRAIMRGLPTLFE